MQSSYQNSLYIEIIFFIKARSYYPARVVIKAKVKTFAYYQGYRHQQRALAFQEKPRHFAFEKDPQSGSKAHRT